MLRSAGILSSFFLHDRNRADTALRYLREYKLSPGKHSGHSGIRSKNYKLRLLEGDPG